MIEYPKLGGYGRDLGHDLGHRFRGPVEWMRVLIPLTNELSNLSLEVLFRCEIGDAQAFALQDAEPLLHLIHPRAMNRREVKGKARVFPQPFSDFFAMMRTDIIAHEMNRLDALVNLRVQLFKKGDELLLTLAWVTLPKDCSRTGIEGSK